ncbi:MAG: carboxypeptidase-like regulatory domain-containing protein [Gemmatimonadaceae bacterium]
MQVRSVLAILACAQLYAVAARGQHPGPRIPHGPVGFVQVEVADANHQPLSDVVLAVLDSADNALFVARTDGRGRSVFGLQTAGRKHLIARKLGFLETRRLLLVREGDTLRVSLVLARVPPQLDTVRVTARRRSDNYYIDARMIAGSQHHYVKDAYDALRDINPGCWVTRPATAGRP